MIEFCVAHNCAEDVIRNLKPGCFQLEKAVKMPDLIGRAIPALISMRLISEPLQINSPIKVTAYGMSSTTSSLV